MYYGTAEKGLERLGEFTANLSRLVDVDLPEERLVDLAPQLWPCLEVLGVIVLKEGERERQVPFDQPVGVLGRTESLVYLAEYDADPFLLVAKQVKRDGFGVVSLE
jgi:hypothetical protein